MCTEKVSELSAAQEIADRYNTWYPYHTNPPTGEKILELLNSPTLGEASKRVSLYISLRTSGVSQEEALEVINWS